jgi:hypothetical protein
LASPTHDEETFEHMTRKIHTGLVHLFAAGLVVQLFLAGLGAFETVHNKKFNDNNFGPHGIVGTILVLVALLIALVAVAGRWSPTVTKLSGGLFGLMILQLILGVAGAGSAPVLGGLHVLNAIVIVWVTYRLVQLTRTHRTGRGEPREDAVAA